MELPSDFSDGRPEFWPSSHDYIHQPGDRLYHQKLAHFWVEGHSSVEFPGAKPIFKELPAGYRIYTKMRNSGHLSDRYIFGHSGGRFDSPRKFFTHFEFLMRGGVGECKCVNCSTRSMKAATHPSMVDPLSSNFATKATMWDCARTQLEDFLSVAKETPGCEIHREWEDIKINDNLPLDYILSPHAFDETASKYRALPTFLPRQGELVLFYINYEPNCRLEALSQHLKLFDESSNQFLGFPAWRAGVVAQVPEDEPGLEDLSALSMKQVEASKNYHVDLYQNPGTKDDTVPSQAYIVKLSQIRPLNMFHEVLSGLAQNEWHSSIYNALEMMSTTSLVRPISIHGQWPSATIKCGGIWIGPELFITGDAIRVMPARKDADQVDSAVIIDCVEWQFQDGNLSEENATVNIRGKSFTTNKAIAFRSTPLSVSDLQQRQFPKSFKGYSWYSINKADKIDPSDPEAILYHCSVIPISRIIGRLYESDAMKYLLGIADFDVSMAGVRQARRWAKRIRQDTSGRTTRDWVHTTNRIRALGINTSNALNIGGHLEENNIWLSGEEAQNQEHLKQAIANGPSNDGTGENSTQNGVYEDALESRKRDGNDFYVPTNINENKSQGFESVNLGRTPGGSEDEDEDQDNFISDILSGNVLPETNDERNEDLTNGGGNESYLDKQRASKRARL